MKKLVALILVLGMSSLASAELIVTVNGEPQPDSITILTSDTIEIDLEIGAGHNALSATIDFVLTNGQAEFVYGGVEFPNMFDFPPVTQGDPQKYTMSGSQFLSPAIAGPAVLMQGLIIHCLDATPVDLVVTSNPAGTVVDGDPYTLDHVLHIEQKIPEPMTVALLGLGGLFLLRRRK
jgi:hypothetical protein